MESQRVLEVAQQLVNNKWILYRKLVKYLERVKFKKDGIRQVKPTSITQARVQENQFLMETMIEQRQKASMKYDKKMVFVFNLAIKALKRYPLPIIHPEQTQDLQGVGNQMIRGIYNAFIAAKRNFKNLKKKPEKPKASNLINNHRINEFLQSIQADCSLSTLTSRIEVKVILLLDNRESLSIPDSPSLLYEKRTLALGDMIWIAQLKYKHGPETICQEEYVMDYIIERKKHKDLLSSNFTHHLQDQLLRLQDSEFTKKYLLIEARSLEEDSIQVYNSISVNTNLNIIYTKQEKQTLELLKNISKKIEIQLEDATLNSVRNRPSFEHFQGKHKKNDSVNEVFMSFIMSFSGIGFDKAKRFVGQYCTFMMLYEEWKNNRDQLIHNMKWCGMGDSLRNSILQFLRTE